MNRYITFTRDFYNNNQRDIHLFCIRLALILCHFYEQAINMLIIFYLSSLTFEYFMTNRDKHTNNRDEVDNLLRCWGSSGTVFVLEYLLFIGYIPFMPFIFHLCKVYLFMNLFVGNVDNLVHWFDFARDNLYELSKNTIVMLYNLFLTKYMNQMNTSRPVQVTEHPLEKKSE
jgi:hypothetical protein